MDSPVATEARLTVHVLPVSREQRTCFEPPQRTPSLKCSDPPLAPRFGKTTAAVFTHCAGLLEKKRDSVAGIMSIPQKSKMTDSGNFRFSVASMFIVMTGVASVLHTTAPKRNRIQGEKFSALLRQILRRFFHRFPLSLIEDKLS